MPSVDLPAERIARRMIVNDILHMYSDSGRIVSVDEARFATHIAIEFDSKGINSVDGSRCRRVSIRVEAADDSIEKGLYPEDN